MVDGKKCKDCGKHKSYDEYGVTPKGYTFDYCNSCREAYYNNKPTTSSDTFAAVGKDQYAVMLKQLSSRAILVLIYLHTHAHGKGRCFILRTTIARAMGVSRKTISGAITELRENGWIRTERRDGQSNIYYFKKPIRVKKSEEEKKELTPDDMDLPFN